MLPWSDGSFVAKYLICFTQCLRGIFLYRLETFIHPNSWDDDENQFDKIFTFEHKCAPHLPRFHHLCADFCLLTDDSRHVRT